MKFKEFLKEHNNNMIHNQATTPHAKVDIVDYIRKHIPTSNKEIMFSNLTPEKEEENFIDIFRRMKTKYEIDGTKDAQNFRNTIIFYLHSPKVPKGHFVKVFALFSNNSLADKIYNQILEKYPKRV